MALEGREIGIPQRLLTPEVAADYLQVTVKTLANWRYLGIGPKYRKVGQRCVRYRLADLDEFLAAGERCPAN